MKRLTRASFFGIAALSLAATSAAQAADVCGARVAVNQIGMTSNEDGTRTVRYRANVQTDQTVCAKVTFSIVRSYIKPDGTPFEDAIPVEVQVPGGAIDVEGETLANTRRLIYWRADKIACVPCANPNGGVPVAPVPAAGGKRTRSPQPTSASSSDGGVKVGKKTVLIAGAAAAPGGAALVLAGGGGAASPGTETPGATPTPSATTPPSPTAAPPTPTPNTPRVFPGQPPAAPQSAENGDLSLMNTDPPAGASVPSTRGTVAIQLQVFIERVTANMRLEIQIFSGGETCLRDVSAPLDLRASQPTILQMPMPNVRRCTAPFRTTLMRAFINDANGAKLVRDFPFEMDFLP